MAVVKYTKAQIDQINIERKAKFQVIYYDTLGNAYEGTSTGNLNLLQSAKTTPVTSDSFSSTNVNDALEELSNKAGVKEVIVDFGDEPYQTFGIFTITDVDAKEGQSIVVSKSIKSIPSTMLVSGKDADEMVAETLELSGKCNNGIVVIYVKSLVGSISGKFSINYSIK